MTLKDVTGWGLNGFLIADEDVSENANIQRSKLATRTAYISIQPSSGVLSTATKSTDGAFSTIVMPDSGTSSAAFSFRIPDDYASGNLTVDIFWKTAATTNDAKFFVYFGSAGSGNSTAIDDTQTVVDTAAGTTNLINTASVTISSSMFAAGNIAGLILERQPADGSDTLATDLEVILIRISYTARG